MTTLQALKDDHNQTHVNVVVVYCPWCELNKLERTHVSLEDLRSLVKCFSARRDEDAAALERVKRIIDNAERELS